MGRTSNINTGFGSNGRLDVFNVSLNAGFAYSVSPRFSIFGSVGVFGFTHSRVGSIKTPVQTSNNFGFNTNTSGNRVTIGFYYTFFKGKGVE